MGIHDRDYYREPSPHWSFGSSVDSSVCKKIIAVTVVVYLLQMFTLPGGYGLFHHNPGPVTNALDLNPDKLWQVWRFFTYGFCHAPESLMHILFNMLFLWWFGRTLERMLGSREFLFFYLTGLFLSAIGHVAFVKMLGYHNPAMGASGAVMAVVVLYACHYPRQQILLFFVLPIEIRWLVLFYVVYDLHPVLLALSGNATGSGVAHAAHLGGLCYGFLYRKYDLRWSRVLGTRQVPRLGRFFSRKRLKIYREPEPLERKRPPSRSVPKGFEKRVDDILAKISRQGQDSLTEEERQILIKASHRYKKEL